MKSFNKAFETRSTGGNLGKNNRDMRINIEYTLYGDSTTFTVELDPDFYFDDNEDFLFGSTPRYIHPYEYLNLDKLLIEKIMLTIESDKSIYRRIIKFWNNSKNNSDILYIYDDSDKTVTEWFKIDSSITFILKALISIKMK